MEAKTDPDLLDCIMEYAHGRGGRTMESSVCFDGTGAGRYQLAPLYGGNDKLKNQGDPV